MLVVVRRPSFLGTHDANPRANATKGGATKSLLLLSAPTGQNSSFVKGSLHFAETTSSSADLSTLVHDSVHSCAPFDTVTSRSERQDHFGSGFVVIWAAMSLPCSDCALLRSVADAPMTRIHPKLPRNPHPHLGATFPHWVWQFPWDSIKDLFTESSTESRKPTTSKNSRLRPTRSSPLARALPHHTQF